MYEGVSRSFRTGRLERELQVVQLSATGCSIGILCVSLVSFAAITLCVASQQVFIVVYFVFTVVISLWLIPETFGYTLILSSISRTVSVIFFILKQSWLFAVPDAVEFSQIK